MRGTDLLRPRLLRTWRHAPKNHDRLCSPSAMAAGDTQGTRWDVLRAIERLAAKQGAGTFTRCTLGDMLLELPSFEVRFWPGTKRERLRGGGGMQKKYSSISEERIECNLLTDNYFLSISYARYDRAAQGSYVAAWCKQPWHLGGTWRLKPVGRWCTCSRRPAAPRFCLAAPPTLRCRRGGACCAGPA